MTEKTKKPLALVFAADDKTTFALACALLSLKENSPLLFNKADFFVYTQDISDENKLALQKIANLNFLTFKLPFNPSEIKTLGIYTVLTMARYEMFFLLDDYKQALWLDTDILVQGELEPVLSYNQSGIALAKDGNALAANFFARPTGAFDMSAPNYNVGVFLLNDTLPSYRQIAAWCYEQTKILSSVLNWIDQAVLNLALQEFSLIPCEIERKYNSNPFSSSVKIKDAVLLHCAGPNKFWNNFELPYWSKLYNKWLALGGSPKPAQKTALLNKCLFKFKLFIEKVPFLWDIFVYFNKKRFQAHFKRDISKLG